MAEEYWVGFRPQPKKLEGTLVSFDISAATTLSLPEAFARMSTASGFEKWAKQVHKLDTRLGGRIEVTVWDDLLAEGAFSQLSLGKVIEFTLDAFGLLRFTFEPQGAETIIRLNCAKVVPESQADQLKTDALRLLTTIALLAILTGGLIGGYHAGVEYGWWQGMTACTTVAGANGGNALDAILNAPVVRCDVAPWDLFGISLAGWNFLISVPLALIGLVSLRKDVIS